MTDKKYCIYSIKKVEKNNELRKNNVYFLNLIEMNTHKKKCMVNASIIGNYDDILEPAKLIDDTMKFKYDRATNFQNRRKCILMNVVFEPSYYSHGKKYTWMITSCTVGKRPIVSNEIKALRQEIKDRNKKISQLQKQVDRLQKLNKTNAYDVGQKDLLAQLGLEM